MTLGVILSIHPSFNTHSNQKIKSENHINITTSTQGSPFKVLNQYGRSYAV